MALGTHVAGLVELAPHVLQLCLVCVDDVEHAPVDGGLGVLPPVRHLCKHRRIVLAARLVGCHVVCQCLFGFA